MPQSQSNSATKPTGTRRLRLFTWLAPVACLALVWISALALSKEREVLETRLYFAQKTETERVVDRLESVLRVLFTKESALEPGVFKSYITDSDSIPEGARFASPLLNARPPRVNFKKLHFEYGARGRVSYPELPTGDDLALALANEHTTPQALEKAKKLSHQLAAFAPPEVLIGLMMLIKGDAKDPADRAIPEGPFRAFFIPIKRAGKIVSAELILLRGVGPDANTRHVQGIWIDWATLHGALLEIGKGKLPAGELRLTPSYADIRGPGAPPPGQVTANRNGGQLGSLALDVKISGRPSAAAFRWSATMTSLTVAWLVFLASLAALYISLKRAAALAEPRARFASAVTHELRTPLTTFCLYTAMLKDGMVKGEEKQMEYFETLNRESERLRHIVDNVLQNAGLEQGSSGPQTDAAAVPAERLLDDITPLLRRRCESADFGFHREASDLGSVTLGVASQNVERILVNLVDNACKYGPAELPQDSRIEFWSEVRGDELLLFVRDFGAGVPAAFEPRLFEAYERGPAQPHLPSSSSEEGLGLGLSLSRELARTMGGDLTLTRDEPVRKKDASKAPGATFCLALPLAQ